VLKRCESASARPSHLTRGRTHKDAIAFFEIAKKQAKKDPRVIFSDGLDSHRGEYKTIGKEPVAHIANVGIRSHMKKKVKRCSKASERK
jgi:transposase-like protein